MNLVNLRFRFALELAALAAFATWGLDAAGGPARLVLAAGVAATAWGLWVAPSARRRLADPARLAVEVVFFMAAVGNAALLRLLHHDLVELAGRAPAADGRARR